MYCSHCGSEINDDAVICIHCGVATPNHQQRVKCESNPLALIGFILSFFFQIAGLVCSIIAYQRCKQNPKLEGRGMSLAGLIISAVTIGLYVLAFLVWLIFVVFIIGRIEASGGL